MAVFRHASQGVTVRNFWLLFQSVHLVTYSQADMSKYPSREVFARAMVQSFSTSRQKSFSGCAVGKSIEKVETIIIWPSNCGG